MPTFDEYATDKGIEPTRTAEEWFDNRPDLRVQAVAAHKEGYMTPQIRDWLVEEYDFKFHVDTLLTYLKRQA
jgi:hypothetical protein